MTDLNRKAFDIVYDMYNRDIIDSSKYIAVRDALEEIEALESRDKALEDLWEEFGDIPMDDETECMEAPFLNFPAGTHREEIWHWFDERHSKGVPYLLYGGAEDYVSETRRLYKLRKQCFECESKDCCFNHGGECRLPLIHERKPQISEEDGCSDYTCIADGFSSLEYTNHRQQRAVKKTEGSPKMTIEQMSKDYGTTNYGGKVYVLVQQAYIDGPVDAPYYSASAICLNDGVDEYGLYPVYSVTWHPRQDWLDSDRDDEGWACDWDSADDVERTGAGYSLSEGRTI